METQLVQGGFDQVWAYDNIAITVLILGMVFSGAFNIILLTALLKTNNKFMELKDALNAVVNTISILNERLHSNHD